MHRAVSAPECMQWVVEHSETPVSCAKFEKEQQNNVW
jgi:hypothetical protein